MYKFKRVVFMLTALSFVGFAQARDQIEIVGSSTVFPFATTVAEQFGRATKFKTPVIESTGSGGGLKLFCAGIGLQHPDITNASRRIKNKEFKNAKPMALTSQKWLSALMALFWQMPRQGHHLS